MDVGGNVRLEVLKTARATSCARSLELVLAPHPCSLHSHHTSRFRPRLSSSLFKRSVSSRSQIFVSLCIFIHDVSLSPYSPLTTKTDPRLSIRVMHRHHFSRLLPFIVAQLSIRRATSLTSASFAHTYLFVIRRTHHGQPNSNLFKSPRSPCRARLMRPGAWNATVAKWRSAARRGVEEEKRSAHRAPKNSERKDSEGIKAEVSLAYTVAPFFFRCLTHTHLN